MIYETVVSPVRWDGGSLSYSKLPNSFPINSVPGSPVSTTDSLPNGSSHTVPPKNLSFSSIKDKTWEFWSSGAVSIWFGNRQLQVSI